MSDLSDRQKIEHNLKLSQVEEIYKNRDRNIEKVKDPKKRQEFREIHDSIYREKFQSFLHIEKNQDEYIERRKREEQTPRPILKPPGMAGPPHLTPSIENYKKEYAPIRTNAETEAHNTFHSHLRCLDEDIEEILTKQNELAKQEQDGLTASFNQSSGVGKDKDKSDGKSDDGPGFKPPKDDGHER